MSLDGSTSNCQLASYPGLSPYPSAVSYMDSLASVVACGGSSLADSTKCWAYDGASWRSLSDSTQSPCYVDAPNVVMGDRWLVAGSQQNGDDRCSVDWTSELFTGTEWVSGPIYPTGGDYFQNSCLAQVNSTHTLLTGGGSWLYNWQSDTWTATSPLDHDRYGHGCATLADQGVLVVGGFKSHGVDYSVELYDAVSDTWSLQPQLPQSLVSYAPILLSEGENILAVFYASSAVYERRGRDGSWTPLPGVRLPQLFDGYNFDKAVLVPDSFALGCI